MSRHRSTGQLRARDPVVEVAVHADGVRSPVAGKLVKAVVRVVCRAERVRAARLSVSMISDRKIAVLNRKHFGRPGATDVISFAFAPMPNAGVVGDVYIAPRVARTNARRLGVTVREETVRLVIHGVLHVLGYDHPDDASRTQTAMWRRQEALVRRALTVASA